MNFDILKGRNKQIGGTLKSTEIKEFQNELSNKLKDMEERFTIDRFEGEFALCENRKTGQIIQIEKSKLPKNIKEGTIIRKVNNNYAIDIEESEKVAQRIKEKMDNLWN